MMQIQCANCEAAYEIDGATGSTHVVRCMFCDDHSVPDSGRTVTLGGFQVDQPLRDEMEYASEMVARWPEWKKSMLQRARDAEAWAESEHRSDVLPTVGPNAAQCREWLQKENDRLKFELNCARQSLDEEAALRIKERDALAESKRRVTELELELQRRTTEAREYRKRWEDATRRRNT